MGTHVSFEIRSGWKGLQADGTLEGSIGCVDAHVSLQGTRLHVGRMALAATIWSLPRVDSLVHSKISSAGKCLGAIETLEGSFSRVGAYVLIESTTLCECLDAVWTLVGPLTSVGTYVISQIARIQKFLRAMRTLVLPFACVESLVKIHLLFADELFATNGTRMRLGFAFDHAEH